MTLKRHHKIILGGFTSIILIFMIISSISLYSLFIKQNLDYNSLNREIKNTQNNVHTLTETVIQTKESLSSLNIQIGSISQEMILLKASAGEDFSGIIEDAVKSVVTINTNSGQGTGFIISNQGYIVTNAHILADEFGNLASLIQARTYEQKIINADFIGYDRNFDIALLKISGDYNSLEIGDSDNNQIGEKVIAIGNPLGLQFSVSEGIISGIHRKGINGVEAYVQTDAALNPGNSGGPLINKKGEVIGINNFKISGGENLGFALESNYVKKIINEISEQALNQTLIY
jgi:S1-C subfamily serine protease